MEKVFSKMRKLSCFTKIFTKFGWQDIRIYATICDENEENNLSQQIVESGVKSRKISIFKEFLRHDKNTFHLPRQYTGETYGMNHTKPINKEFLEDDSNFYTAFTQYNLDEIWKSERELKYMIKVLFVCHGNILANL